MKRFLSVTLIIVLTLTLLLTACGQKKIQRIEITEGLKLEYTIGEELDTSGVKANIIYNDGTSIPVNADELQFSDLDTRTAGKKDLKVTYKDYTEVIEVTVKDKSVDIGAREVVSIEYFSGIPAKIFVNDIIHFDQLKIVVNYSDGTEETKDIATNSNIKHNGDKIDTSKAGTQVLTITFMGKSVDVNIVVNEIILTSIEVDGDTVDTTIVEGTSFDPTGMVVYAVYNNGARLAINSADLAIAQDGTKVTISYQGKSTELTLSTEPPVAVSMSITSTGYESTNNTIVLGDKFHTSGVKATALMNNGTSKTIANSDLIFSSVEINAAGEYTVTATYKNDESIKADFSFTVLGITKVVIDTTSVDITIAAGNELNLANLTIIITCSDGSKVERSITDGVVIDSTKLNTTEIGNDSYITATYGGVASEKLMITVHDPNLSYFIIDYDLPKSLTSLDSKKDLFINKNYGYVVGDDNGFIFKLNLTILNDADQIVEGFSQYTSYFEIYLDGTLLEGAALDEYATIDAKNNSIDFTDAAIGKKFTIKTRPLHGVEDNAELRSIDVEVVDGLNIYEAWELNYLTNNDDFVDHFSENDSRSQTQIVDEFLATKGKTRPTGLSGIVLHNDLIIKTTDIPAEYFLDNDRTKELWETITVFSHRNDSANGVFNFYGNYFTVFSYNIPNVCALGTGNQDDYVSNAQLFRFTAASEWGGYYDHTKYTTNIYSLYMRDDNPNTDNIMTADRDMRGLIGMKVEYSIANLENVRMEAYYIGFFIDNDYTTANLNECTLYNSWQNHIYVWSANNLQDEGETPREDYPVATLNVTNSSITKCGGPVIIAQTKFYDKPKGAKSGAQVNIDANTEIWTYVTGEEAWFKAMGATGIASDIKTLGYILQQAQGSTFITQYDENHVTSGGTVYMNIVMVNLVAGTDVATVLKSADDLDGKLVIGETAVLDMTDTYSATHVLTQQQVGYGNAGVAQLIGGYAGQAPVFNTAVGGVGVINGEYKLVTDLTADPTTNAMNAAALTMGDYIALYMNNMGIVLGYNME